MPDVLIYANPIAGRGRGAILGRRLEQSLAASSFTPMLLLEPAGNWPAENLPPDPAAVIVIGGDGTLRNLVQRYWDLQQSTPPILLIATGTANLIGQTRGISGSDRHLPDKVLQSLTLAKIETLDMARAGNAIFLATAGVGIDAQIVHELAQTRTGPIDKSSYLIPAASVLRRYAYPPLTVQADGLTVFNSQPAMAFIANVPEYGVGFPLLPDARPDDGLLDLCVIPCSNPHDLLSIFLHAAAGEHLQVEGVMNCRAKSILIESESPIPLQLDGEAAGHTPTDIHLIPGGVRFIVPSE